MAATEWIGGSGDWGDASNWSAGVPNDSAAVADLDGANAYVATIAAGENFTVGTVNIADPNAVLNLWGTLAVNSAIDLSAGTLTIAGTIVGGEIRQTGGTINFAGALSVANSPYPGAHGTLDGVTFVGAMNLTADYAAIAIKDGLTVTGSDGTSPGVVNVTGYSSEIDFIGSQTFDNATLNIGNDRSSPIFRIRDDNGTPATLTLGPNSNIVFTTGGISLYGDSDAAIVNQGTITAGISNRTSYISIDFTNQGTVDISNGQNLIVSSAAFSNTGTINVDSGATLSFQGNQVGSQLGNIVVNDGLVEIHGVLDNSGNVLNVGAGSGLGSIQLWGTIRSGTIRDGGSGITYWGMNATLDGVAYQGTLTIGQGGFTVLNGLTLENLAGTGPGKLAMQGGLVLLKGSQTLDNATVVLGGTLEGSADGSGETLTFGSGLTIRTGGYGSIGADTNMTLLNEGRIVAQTAGESLTISAGNFTNSGTIAIANSGTVILNSPNFVNTGTITITGNGSLQLWSTYGAGGSYKTANLGTIRTGNGGILDIEGTLANIGAILHVGGNNPLHRVTLGGTINDGAIADAGGGFNFRGGILDHVQYRGTMALDIPDYGQTVQIYGGITLTGANGTGRGAMVVGNGVVQFRGTQSVNNAKITLGGVNGEGDIGAFSVPGISTVATLTLGAHLTVVTGGTTAGLVGDGRIVNRGSVIADTVGGSLSIASAAFVNAGAVIVGNGEAVTVATGFTNNSAVEIIEGTLDLQKAVAGTGSIQIDAAGVLDTGGTVGMNQLIHFYGAGGTLRIGAANAFAASLEGFGQGDIIDLANVAFGSRTTMHFSGDTTGGTLTVSDGTHTAKLKLIGDYTGGSFSDTSDGSGFTQITFAPATAAAKTLTAAAGESRLHQFASAIAAHSADGAAFDTAVMAHGPITPADRLLAAAVHH